MAKHLGYFGGRTYGRLILEDGQREEIWFDRDLWFDWDEIDGRWLVGVTDGQLDGEERVGAIVVKDPRINAFIELLGALVAKPEQFADETLTLEPDWDGRVPVRERGTAFDE